MHLPARQFQSVASQHEPGDLYFEIETVIIFTLLFEISSGGVISQSELHYIIPGAKTLVIIILVKQGQDEDFFNKKLIFVKLKPKKKNVVTFISGYWPMSHMDSHTPSESRYPG